MRRGRGSDRLGDAPVTHFLIGGLICLFVLSPALLTPWGFGPDFSNHLWLVWQQGLAISDTGHPTLFLQTPGGVFEPFYGFYGGTLYAMAGAGSAILGNHAYPVYIASLGFATAFAYGGMWWLGRQLGLSQWVAHLPAFVLVTGAYYLTDAYARGAWPEFVALSTVPMFLAAGARLLGGPWRAGPVALFVIATVVLTGSHNVTLFWSVVVIGPLGTLAWLAAGGRRPPLVTVAKIAGLALLAVGINAWFLGLDIFHSVDTIVVARPIFDWKFTAYFDTVGAILNPVRNTPAESGTYGLIIAAPIGAPALSVVLAAFAWRENPRTGRWLRAVWLMLLAAMVVLVWLMIMPASWWHALGTPFTLIQFPYRLAGWLLLAISVQLAASLRLARDVSGRGRVWMAVLAGVLLIVTIVQAAAQLYTHDRLDGSANGSAHVREIAFAHGRTTPPDSYYDPHSYSDASRPVVETKRGREILLPAPSPGASESETTIVAVPPARAPIATNIAAGPYVARVEGMTVLGRTAAGAVVVEPPPHGRRTAHLAVVADGGTRQILADTISIACLFGVLALLIALAMRPRLRHRCDPVAERR